MNVGYFRSQTAMASALQRLSAYDEVVVAPAQARLDVVAERVRESLTTRSLATLSRSDWRVVPWVMWRPPFAAHDEWFLAALFKIIASDKPPSVIRALTHAYIAFFVSDNRSIISVANFLRHSALPVANHFGEKWLAIDQRFSIFEPDLAARQLGAFAGQSPDPVAALEHGGIQSERLDDNLVAESFSWATRAVASRIRTSGGDESVSRSVQNLLRWNTATETSPRYTHALPEMASSLFEAMKGSALEPATQNKILQYFIRMLGDPRLNRTKWAQVSADAMSVVMRLLIHSTLDDFFRVIDATAEARHWHERRRFWLAYHEAGAVTDAWVAFGPKAVGKAGVLAESYGALLGAQDKARSALIIRIGTMVIVEMSHNGKCNFFPSRAGSAQPIMYDRTYNNSKIGSSAEAYGEQLVHHLNWRPRAANIIALATGVRHPDFGNGNRW